MTQLQFRTLGRDVEMSISGSIQVLSRTRSLWRTLGSVLPYLLAASVSGVAVVLRATNVGRGESLVGVVTIGLGLPGGPYAASPGEAVSFDGSGSFDPDGTAIVEYEWDFDGDGVFDISTANPNVQFTYDADYAGPIVIRVTDGDGETALGSTRIVINAAGSVPQGDSEPCAIDAEGLPIFIDDADGLTLLCTLPADAPPEAEGVSIATDADPFVPPPAVTECSTEVLPDGNVEVTWSAFNGEDDRYQVRADDDWRAAVSADSISPTGDLSWIDSSPVDDAEYVIISREAGSRVERTCALDDAEGETPDRPSCTVEEFANGNVRLTWDARDIENDNYQVRVDGRWRASVGADGELSYVGAPGSEYVIRSDEDGARLDIRCE